MSVVNRQKARQAALFAAEAEGPFAGIVLNRPVDTVLTYRITRPLGPITWSALKCGPMRSFPSGLQRGAIESVITVRGRDLQIALLSARSRRPLAA